MLDVERPAAAPLGEPLTAEQRAQLEDGLAAAGLKVQPGGPV